MLAAAEIARRLEIGEAVELDLLKGPNSVLAHLAAYAREKAIDASVLLTRVRPDDQAEITRLQNEVQRYRELAWFTRTSLAEAAEAYSTLDAEEREEVRKFLLGEETNDA